MTKEDWVRKLTSRKFWAYVSEFVVALLIFLKKDKTLAQEVGSLIMLAASPVAYIIGEAWTDAKRISHMNGVPAEELKPPEIDG